ncbi:hypothetical protein DD606_25135 [Enterobacter cloacae complex sp. GF14B]|nr:hypothetical protein DD606_25135 [Enterobacter cloacae complex sp. GF14B]
MSGSIMVLEVFFKTLKGHFYVLLGYQPSVKDDKSFFPKSTSLIPKISFLIYKQVLVGFMEDVFHFGQFTFPNSLLPLYVCNDINLIKT